MSSINRSLSFCIDLRNGPSGKNGLTCPFRVDNVKHRPGVSGNGNGKTEALHWSPLMLGSKYPY